MAHGQPDYGAYTQKRTTYGLADMGELAARLGSIVTFDRRGDVIWLDDFESDVQKWTFNQTGVGGALVSDATRARNGGFCAHLTTGGALGNIGATTHRSPYQVISKTGFEISFTLNGNISEYLFSLYFYDGVNYHAAIVRFLPATNTLEVDNNGAWVQVATAIPMAAALYLFHTLKLVGDFTAIMQYVRVILNEVEYDLSAYNLREALNPAGRQLSVALQLTTGVASSQGCYVDDAIITQNEP